MYTFKQQKTKFTIKSVNKKEKNVHSDLFPNNIRGIICGPSGCGKTEVLYNMIVQEHGLKFTNIYIISQTLEQDKYRSLQEIFNQVQEVKLHLLPLCEITPKDVEVGSLIIFDDVHSDENIAAFFSRGRHQKLNVFYLCQTYTKIKKQLIRDNTNFLILFKQDDLNLKHVYNNHVGNDFTFNEFKNMCNQCWEENYSFVVIDKQSLLNNGRYRCKFDKFYSI